MKTSHFQITTQADLRRHFWDDNPAFEKHRGKPQNSCPADVRMAWVDFVDHMCKSGEISENLAFRATL